MSILLNYTHKYQLNEQILLHIVELGFPTIVRRGLCAPPCQRYL